MNMFSDMIPNMFNRRDKMFHTSIRFYLLVVLVICSAHARLADNVELMTCGRAEISVGDETIVLSKECPRSLNTHAIFSDATDVAHVTQNQIVVCRGSNDAAIITLGTVSDELIRSDMTGSGPEFITDSFINSPPIGAARNITVSDSDIICDTASSTKSGFVANIGGSQSMTFFDMFNKTSSQTNVFNMKRHSSEIKTGGIFNHSMSRNLWLSSEHRTIVHGSMDWTETKLVCPLFTPMLSTESNRGSPFYSETKEYYLLSNIGNNFDECMSGPSRISESGTKVTTNGRIIACVKNPGNTMDLIIFVIFGDHWIKMFSDHTRLSGIDSVWYDCADTKCSANVIGSHTNGRKKKLNIVTPKIDDYRASGIFRYDKNFFMNVPFTSSPADTNNGCFIVFTWKNKVVTQCTNGLFLSSTDQNTPPTTLVGSADHALNQQTGSCPHWVRTGLYASDPKTTGCSKCFPHTHRTYDLQDIILRGDQPPLLLVGGAIARLVAI